MKSDFFLVSDDLNTFFHYFFNFHVLIHVFEQFIRPFKDFFVLTFFLCIFSSFGYSRCCELRALFCRIQAVRGSDSFKFAHNQLYDTNYYIKEVIKVKIEISQKFLKWQNFKIYMYYQIYKKKLFEFIRPNSEESTLMFFFILPLLIEL